MSKQLSSLVRFTFCAVEVKTFACGENSLDRSVAIFEPSRPETDDINAGFGEFFNGLDGRNQCELSSLWQQLPESLSLSNAADADDRS